MCSTAHLHLNSPQQLYNNCQDKNWIWSGVPGDDYQCRTDHLLLSLICEWLTGCNWTCWDGYLTPCVKTDLSKTPKNEGRRGARECVREYRIKLCPHCCVLNVHLHLHKAVVKIQDPDLVYSHLVQCVCMSWGRENVLIRGAWGRVKQIWTQTMCWLFLENIQISPIWHNTTQAGCRVQCCVYSEDVKWRVESANVSGQVVSFINTNIPKFCKKYMLILLMESVCIS